MEQNINNQISNDKMKKLLNEIIKAFTRVKDKINTFFSESYGREKIQTQERKLEEIRTELQRILLKAQIFKEVDIDIIASIEALIQLLRNVKPELPPLLQLIEEREGKSIISPQPKRKSIIEAIAERERKKIGLPLPKIEPVFNQLEKLEKLIKFSNLPDITK
jgi:hypothetical protein